MAAADEADAVDIIKDADFTETRSRRPTSNHLKCNHLTKHQLLMYLKDMVINRNNLSHYSNLCNSDNHVVPHQTRTNVSIIGTTAGLTATTSAILIQAQIVLIPHPVMCGMPPNKIRAEEVQEVNIK